MLPPSCPTAWRPNTHTAWLWRRDPPSVYTVVTTAQLLRLRRRVVLTVSMAFPQSRRLHIFREVPHVPVVTQPLTMLWPLVRLPPSLTSGLG